MRKSFWFALLPVAALGCGDGLEKFPVAQVTGIVLCEGQPVPHALVNFAPRRSKGQGAEVGKMGVGVTQDDGTFAVSTYGDEDGAVVGGHSVSVSPPNPEHVPNFHCNCETIGGKKPVMQVEVKADGENDFTIELTPKVQSNVPTQKKRDAEDEEQASKERPS